MKKYFFIILLVLVCSFEPFNVFAWSDNDTHPKITKLAVEQSLLNNDISTYLKDNFGFKNGLTEIIYSSINIETLIMNGSRTEDTGILPAPWHQCSRGLNHFYNPLYSVNDVSAGLFDCGFKTEWFSFAVFQGKSNLLWATSAGYSNLLSVDDDPSEDQQKNTDYNCYSWKVAREVFIKALTTKDNADRNRYFARMFRSVGQITHLLQDMAVPAHVRNDMKGHLSPQGLDLSHDFDSFGNNFEGYVKKRPELVHGNIEPPPFNKLTDFWDTDNYNGDANITSYLGYGLAEYTQANFLSEWRKIGAYPHPSKNDGFFDHDNPEFYWDKDGKLDRKFYFKKEQGEPLQHLAAEKYLYKFLPATDPNNHYLDELCYNEYAHKLLPKAIGYSAGLINYFFRGTLKVTEALSIDGDDSGIKKITAKVINTSPNNEQQCEGKTNCAGKEYMSNGEVFAFARYKTGPNDNTTSYAVSGPAKDKDGADIKSIDYKTPAKMTFDFSNSPIPANAQELYLHVVYYGTLGNEADTGVAIGMDEVSKLYVLLRSGNNYTLYSISTDSVVEKLKNPRYGNPLYPEAKEFFKFPEEGAQNSTDFGFYIENYLKETDSQALLMPDTNYPEHDNDQDIIPAPYDNNTQSGTSCPNIPGGSGTYNISCAGSSKGRHYGFNSGDSENHFFQIASPKDETVTYVSDYITSDSFVSGTWNNSYNGAFEWVIDPESCDSMPDGSQKCNCWIAALEQRPYAWSQTTNVSLDETLKGEYSVTRFTPLGKLYTIPFTNNDSVNKQTSHDKIGQPFNTSKMCGWLVPSNRYSLTEVYYGDLVGVEYTNDVESTHTYGFDWGNDPYHFYSARVHLESNALLHYYVSFPILEDITESQIAYKKVYVDHGYYVLAQLNVKDGLYDPLSKKFDVDYKNDWKENGKFEDAIKALIDFSLALTPTLKDFDAGFWIKK